MKEINETTAITITNTPNRQEISSIGKNQGLSKGKEGVLGTDDSSKGSRPFRCESIAITDSVQIPDLERRRARFRNICFTWNNPPITEICRLDLFSTLSTRLTCVYLIAQLEKGENGTVHIQGYAEFDKQHTFMDFIQNMPGCHIEQRRGSQQQAIDYCKKSETSLGPYYEWGTPKAQGTRTDIEGFRDDILKGDQMSDLINDHPLLVAKYPKFINTVRNCIKRERRIVEVEFHVGEPGTGKTRAAYEYDSDLFVVPIGKDMWFDGYDCQTTLLIDDFSGQMQLAHLLRLLDCWPVQVPIKGSFSWLNVKKIIVTSNLDPFKWYDFKERHDRIYYRALMRRMTAGYYYFSQNSILTAPEWWTFDWLESRNYFDTVPQILENTDYNRKGIDLINVKHNAKLELEKEKEQEFIQEIYMRDVYLDDILSYECP